jgi:hypothetical protein
LRSFFILGCNKNLVLKPSQNLTVFSNLEIFLNDVVVAFPALTAKQSPEGYPNSVPKYGVTLLLELNMILLLI